jgi:hypothetical protein
MTDRIFKALDPKTFDLLTFKNGVIVARSTSMDKILNHLKKFNTPVKGPKWQLPSQKSST